MSENREMNARETEKSIVLLTGAAGFLGSHICDTLLEQGRKVRALVLPGDKSVKYIPQGVEISEGNLCDMDSLDAFFDVPQDVKIDVIHCASMVTTNPDFSQKLIDINVGGTKNMIEQCLKRGNFRKMVYVSSTGAIPELPKGTAITETHDFSDAEHNDKVVGWYSKSKAMATDEVLRAVRQRDLNACVVHPSGILGPKDFAIGETTGTVIKIMNGEMPVGMGGSFNLCDVRDLAFGCVSAIANGRKGECYILGNKEVTLKEVCQMLHDASGCKMPFFYVPINMAYKLAAQMEKKAEKTGEKPLMTNFAVYNLARNNKFDYSKAERELGYHTRPYAETLRDEAAWIVEQGYIKEAPKAGEMLAEGAEKLAQANGQIAGAVADGYKKVEHAVVGGYKQIEKAVVDSYTKVEDGFVGSFLTRDGETAQEAKARLKGMQPQAEAEHARGRALIEAVAAAEDKDALRELLHSNGIDQLTDEMLDECWRYLALSQDMDAMRDIFSDKDFASCRAKLAAHGIEISQEDYALVSDILSIGQDPGYVRRLMEIETTEDLLAELQKEGYRNVTMEFLDALKENAISIASDGILTAEEIKGGEHMSIWKRYFRVINRLFAMSTVTELTLRTPGAASPAYTIAMACGVCLM